MKKAKAISSISKKIQIGILEYHCHVPDLFTLCKICKTSKTNVTVFTKKNIWNGVLKYLDNAEEYNVIFQDKNENNRKFIRRVETLCNKHNIELLFIQTIFESILDLPNFKKFNPRSKVIFSIHSINAWLNNKNLISNIKNIFRKPMHINDESEYNLFLRPWYVLDTIISSIYINRYILPRFDGFIVYQSPMIKYIKSLGYNKPVFLIPAGFYDGKERREERKKDNKIIFGVIGKYDEKRRDYDIVLDVFEKIFRKYNDKTSLMLLGRPRGFYGKNVIKKSQNLNYKWQNIKYFSDFIPYDEYNKLAESVDFLVCPIRMETWGEGVIREIAGITRAGSGPLEAVRFRKPLIVPEKYEMPEEFKSSTLKYKDKKDLYRIVEEIIKNPEKKSKYAINATKNAEKFSLPILQKYFEETILKKMNIM